MLQTMIYTIKKLYNRSRIGKWTILQVKCFVNFL